MHFSVEGNPTGKADTLRWERGSFMSDAVTVTVAGDEGSDLVLCVYCSASIKPEMTRAEIDTLLEECRRKNSAADISGMLLYKDGSFFQSLEGKRSAILALYEKIGRDKRHNNVTKIVLEKIEERTFSNWSMGFPKVTFKELDQVPGLNDFFGSGSSFFELGPGRAKSLLSAFKEGKWRASLGGSGRKG